MSKVVVLVLGVLLLAVPAHSTTIKRGPGGGAAGATTSANCAGESGVQDDQCVEEGTGGGYWLCDAAACPATAWTRTDDTTGGAIDTTATHNADWSDGSNATNTWTFDVIGQDTTMAFGDGDVTFSHDVDITGDLSPATMSGNIGGIPTWTNSASFTGAQYIFGNSLDVSSGQFEPPRGTALPGAPDTGDTIVILDDSVTGACDSAAGSAVTHCYWTGAAWVALGDGNSGGAAGADTQVQYNTSGSFGGATQLVYTQVADFEWSPQTDSLLIGDADEGIVQLGTAFMGMANDSVGGLTLDDILITYNPTDVATDVAFMHVGGANVPRFVIQEEGAGNVTWNPRSFIVGPGATAFSQADDDFCAGGAAVVFPNIDCDTTATGADLGVEDDIEVLGDVYIGGSLVTANLGTPSAGVLTNATGYSATNLAAGTIPAARVGAAHIDLLTEIGDLCDGDEILERNTGDTAWACIATPSGGGSLSNIVEDVTPQLGGDLDLNGNNITGLTASRAMQTNGSGVLEVSAVTETELNLLDGLTGTIATTVGTPVNDQVGVWTGDGTIEGDADLTFDGTDLTVGGDVAAASVTVDPSDTAEMRLTSATGADEISIGLTDNGTTTTADFTVDDGTGDDVAYMELDGATATVDIFKDVTVATGENVTVSNLGVEFTDSDTNPTCSAGEYKIYADLSETDLKKCVNGSATDMDTTGGTPATADISDVSVTQTELAELETIGATSISAADWTAVAALVGVNTGDDPIPTHSDCSVAYAPSAEVAATDDIQSVFRAPAAVTITEVWCETDTGTVTMDVQIDDGSPADVMGVDLVCAATAVSDSAGLTGSMADGDRLDWLIASVATNPTRLTVCIEYTFD